MKDVGPFATIVCSMSFLGNDLTEISKEMDAASPNMGTSAAIEIHVTKRDERNGTAYFQKHVLSFRAN